MRLLLDEHLSPRIAEALTAEGHDVVAVARRPDLLGASDEALLSAATAEGRALVTRDVVDFTRLARALAAEGTPHAGIVLVPPGSRGVPGIGPLVDGLRRLLLEHRDGGLDSTVTWVATGER